jgi:periplasmic protein TonB
MSDQKGAERDMLDIIFSTRNKAYGAYQLRRDYPSYVGKAMLVGLLLIAFFYAIPALLSAVKGVLENNKPIEVVAEMGPPPDIDPNLPPPPPPPPVETPPPPTRTTQKFVPPVVKQDKEIVEEPPQKSLDELKETDKDIGKEDKEGKDDAPPALEDNPTDKIVEAKEAPKVDNTVYEFVEKMPSFPGGEAELQRYLVSNIKFPQFALESSIQGRVFVTFVVERDGSITDVKCIKDIGGGCGKEAERVVRTMPKWVIGEQNGSPVRVKFTIPVSFTLK